ncbi:cell division topological specificity factor [Clostridium pasteurianum DSM 525 = ATCC 6013]|uniref:Cell division topological specificity factor n=1 Tax=Clostridium pasteurianum DSM 525 = ATCC 6013 TaxID=1262449 RepID=A0A0H3J8V1_CLOPA|nr:cell division topological specificity factor MinE [Clostridium pasteurianum]AJA48413.1 cell division topological specificity factor [Clostridium pasteurianum DSM 525 = ATCC 6013]AJA52401.1 cell division topological specificity factor [Clostridium pasteurianum DSM 525 = ATCC 6013]AOZ75658.1 cell division topological specificity factor MinE [Clostridium pasteurianum DSM 525 = ATCC 6013]AOZ79454.1 cell division topological specificity factor MinE [Clostridium pasteurianum]ELP60437.1 Cell divis
MDLFRLFSNRPSSKDVAKERLKLILIHDRADLSPELLELIKGEIMNVIARYVEIDNSDVEVKLTKVKEQDGNSPALVANIPIRKMKAKK